MVLAPFFLTCTVGCQSTQKTPAQAERDPAASAAHWEALFADRVVADEFSTELVNELKSRVRTFTRPVRVYHYGGRSPGLLDAPRADMEAELRSLVAMPVDTSASKPALPESELALAPYRTPLELSPKEAVTYFEKFSSLFREGQLESIVGPGIYASIDPVQSESYAKNTWFLMEIEVPTGSRYLDLRPTDGIVVSKAFIEKWFPKLRNGNGDRVANLKRIGNNFYISWNSVLEHDALRRMVSRSLASLKVDAIAYSWSSPSSELCGKIAFEQRTGFNFIEPSFAKRAKLRVFVENMGLDPAASKTKEYRRIFDLIHSYPLAFFSYHSTDPRTLNSSDPGPRLGPANFKMRTSTYAWTASLMRPYPLSEILVNPRDAEQFYGNAGTSLNGASQGYPFSSLSELPVDTSRMSCTTVTESGNTRNTCNYSPLDAMRKSDPKKAAAILAQYRKWTFGCSEKYPGENRTPEL